MEQTKPTATNTNGISWVNVAIWAASGAVSAAAAALVREYLKKRYGI